MLLCCENILRNAFTKPTMPSTAKKPKPYMLIAKGMHKITKSKTQNSKKM
jgi:hypothetical protein